MKTAYLFRGKSDDNQTLGVLIAEKDNGQLFVCRTLERAWKDNKPDISCIPEGTYTCRFTVSPHLSQITGHTITTYELLDVPNRSGIRIHSANYYRQLLGCIALGRAYQDLDGDGEMDAVQSYDTVNEFNTIMDGEDFFLTIKSLDGNGS